MIAKIVKEKATDRTMLIDNVVRVSYGSIIVKNDKQEYVAPSYEGAFYFYDSNSQCGMELHLFLKDGTKIIVITHCPVYMLNDSGKTIERIN